MKQFLYDNWCEAWALAVEYHDCIFQEGVFSLEIQKLFVSMLHNSVELLLKQILIDNGDHMVAWVRDVKSEEGAKLNLEYVQSTDLNRFFIELSSKSREMINKFCSIDYNHLIDNRIWKFKIRDKTIGERVGEQPQKDIFKQALQTIQTLRNNETHFFITESFLSEGDFFALHNFMIVFYKCVVIPCLCCEENPWAKYFLRSDLRIDNWNIISEFHYKDAIKKNKKALILKELYGKTFESDIVCLDYLGSLFSYALFFESDSGYSSREIYQTLSSMLISGVLELVEEHRPCQDEDGRFIGEDTVYRLDFKI